MSGRTVELPPGGVGRELRGLQTCPRPPRETRSLLPGCLQLLCLAPDASTFKNSTFLTSKCSLGLLRFLGDPPTLSSTLGSWRGHRLQSCLGPPPQLPSRLRSRILSLSVGFFPGTFQEPESRDSAGQRAFVRRWAGEGRARPGARRSPTAGARRPGRGPPELEAAFCPGGRGGLPRGRGFSPKWCALGKGP